MIRTYFSQPRHKEGGSNDTADTKRAATWAVNFQLAILNWYGVGVKATCGSIGGEDIVKTVAKKTA